MTGRTAKMPPDRGQRGSMLLEYVIVVVIILLGGSLSMGGGSSLLEMTDVSVSGEDYGIFGNYAVDWFRRLMWMIAQPFP